MKKFRLILLIPFLFISCDKSVEVLIPDLTWDLFESPDAVMLKGNPVTSMEGVYTVTNGRETFGDQIALKTSWVVDGTDTTYHITLLCGTDVAYFICTAKDLDSTILLEGYWRKVINTETGVARFTINLNSGARQLLSGNPIIAADSIIIDGVFGNGNEVPEQHITLTYNRPLHNRNGFQILAHRAGGRTSDHLSVSENSIAMIKKSQEFGSTGIEIDIRLTSDHVAVLYHDNTINERLVTPNGMIGPIENYSFAQLTGMARLINGEKIPTLREALETVVYNTNLEFVWLDTKYTGDMALLQSLQSEFLQKAAAVGRTNLEILIGLPTDDQITDLKTLPDFTNVPSLCELTRENVRELNSKVWAPRWTLGTQNSEVQGVHDEGRKAFTWTMDVPEYIHDYIEGGIFDGILTNYPSIVAFYEYVR
jgi:glycerophosphoryl diester phosphodiesterase